MLKHYERSFTRGAQPYRLFFFNIPASITFFFSHFIDVFSSTVNFEHTTLLNDVAISLRVF